MTLNLRARQVLLVAIPALLGGTAGLILISALAGNAANPGIDNSGDIKVHVLGAIGDPANDPHVGCPFYIEGFNMDASNGTLEIESWPPTGNGAVVLSTTWAKDDSNVAGHHFINGPYTLADGHYKVYASDQKHDKMKVFWVDCNPTTSSSSSPPTSTGTQSTSTSSQPTSGGTQSTSTSSPPTSTGTQSTSTSSHPNSSSSQTTGPTTSVAPGHGGGGGGGPPGNVESPGVITRVAFFPSWTALALGLVGSVAAALVVLRRRP